MKRLFVNGGGIWQPAPRLWRSVRQYTNTQPSKETVDESKPVSDNKKAPSADKDWFKDMLDDRTKVLLRSLGNPVDIEELELQASQDQTGNVLSNRSPKMPTMAPYVLSLAGRHYFDTQAVFDALKEAGLTELQAEGVMNTLLDMISELATAISDTTVPKSAGANEAYLFDAASSEMRNEIQAQRLTLIAQFRVALSRLDRDAEILGHESMEMASSLKSDLDIEMYERKNAAKAEEYSTGIRIQELHNKIATRLNSELKSEIEKLRWQITRRSIAAVAVTSLLILYVSQTFKVEEKKRQPVKETRTSEVAVPVLTPSLASDEDDIVADVEELGDSQPSPSTSLSKKA